MDRHLLEGLIEVNLVNATESWLSVVRAYD